MRTTTSGLLLLLVGVIALAGFVSGNLDRWLDALFNAQPSAPPALPAVPAPATATSARAVSPANRRTA